MSEVIKYDNRDIDVYSDKFKKLKIIDFDKLEKEAERIHFLSAQNSQGVFWYIIDAGLVLFALFLLISEISEGNFGLALLSIMLYGLFIGVPYIFIKRALVKSVGGRAKNLPSNTPKEILDNVAATLKKDSIKFILYKNFILKKRSDERNADYESFQSIGPVENENEFFKEAYNKKANMIINYQVDVHKFSKVTTKGIGRGRYVDTDVKELKTFQGEAIRVLNEKTENNNIDTFVNNISKELKELVELRDKNILSEEEFEIAKKKLIS